MWNRKPKATHNGADDNVNVEDRKDRDGENHHDDHEDDNSGDASQLTNVDR
jgi:hypothetical protein